MSDVPLMMPVAGLSFYDVSLAALECNHNRVRTAKRLGVGIRSLDAAIAREGLERWFISHTPGIGPKSAAGSRNRKRCVSREQIQQKADLGMSCADAATSLCISEAYLKQLCIEYKISFAGSRSSSVSAAIARRKS